MSLLSGQAAAQNLVVPPNVTVLPNSSFTTITINAGGSLFANQITVTAGGSQTDITVNGTSGTAVGGFTNTLINLGNGNTGIAANGPGAAITMGEGSLVFSSGGGAQFGVRVTNGARVSFVDGASINIAGGSAAPVEASSGGIFDMVGGSITKSGAGANAIRAGDGSTPGIVRLDGTTVTMQGTGGNASGVWASVAGSRAELIDTTVIINQGGGQNYGVRTTQGAIVGMTDSSIRVLSNNSTGLQITTGGTATVNGGSIVTEGFGGQGIYVSGTGQNNGTFNGTEVRSNHGTGILAQGNMSSNLNFSNGASVTGGNGTVLLNQVTLTSSVLNLTGDDHVTFTGDVDARDSVGTTNIKLAGTTSLSGAVNVNQFTGADGIEPAQPVINLPRMNVNIDIDSTSVWNMRTSSTVNNLNVDSGARILFAASSEGASSFRTLALNRLTGTGGIFRMDVNLGQVRGDLIYIQASSEGEHSLALANVSPASELPENRALLVVRTPDGASSYGGEVDGGVFRYTVVRGDGSSLIPNPNDWYIVRLGGPDDPDGPLPPAETLTPPANAAVGTIAATFPMFHANLGSLEQQFAELRMTRREVPPAPTTRDFKESKEVKEVKTTPRPSNGFWVRGFGNETEIDPRQSREFDQLLGGGEIGFDRRFDFAGGDLYLGAYAGYLRATRDFHDGSDGSTDALSVGLYGEWIDPSGWFVEVVLKHIYFWNDFSAPTTQSTVDADYNVPAFGGMLEIGKRWDLGNVFIEPYASLAGGWADSVDYEMSNGLKVNADEQSSLRGRLGIRAGLHWEFANGRALEPYVRVGVMNEFLGDDQITMNGFDFNPRLSGAVVEASAGMSARLNQAFNVYAGYSYANGDKIRSPWAATLGLRWEW